MGYVIAIFGSLVALNWGFGYWLSEENENANKKGVVEVEQVTVSDTDESQTDAKEMNPDEDVNK